MRKAKELSQKAAAVLLDISLRTYIRYEEGKPNINIKRKQKYISLLESYEPITENKGILTIDKIKNIGSEIFKKHNAEFCILFGSYAKGKAREDSDIDLLILCPDKGLSFFGLAEELRQSFHKKVDLLDANHISEDKNMLFEIMKTGVRIYG